MELQEGLRAERKGRSLRPDNLPIGSFTIDRIRCRTSFLLSPMSLYVWSSFRRATVSAFLLFHASIDDGTSLADCEYMADQRMPCRCVLCTIIRAATHCLQRGYILSECELGNSNEGPDLSESDLGEGLRNKITK